MAWPTPQDYNEAIQNPAQCFSDPELQRGIPEVTALGLPRPITGNFTSVYRLTCGGRDWAVRCFWREFADLRTRYAAISAHLAAVRLPYTVGFQYIEQGIRVRGQWYPVLKMEWVEGELLDDYIERNLHDGALLRSLTDAWKTMCGALEAARVAHGDLQHGNVIVAAGRLILVDYDGMYVPSLAGRSSHETGHPNYQHPGRTGSDFGPYLDNFSAWSIYLSLQATAEDPSIWSQLGGGDECLLFRRRDYEDPRLSTAFAAMSQGTGLTVRHGVDRLLEFLAMRPEDVPALAARASLESGPDNSEWSHSAPTWASHIMRALIPSVPFEACLVPPQTRSAGPEWLADHLSPVVETETFDPPHSLLRAALPLLASILVSSVVVLVAFAIPLPVVIAADSLAAVAVGAVLIGGYRLNRPVRDITVLLSDMSAVRRQLSEVHADVNALERDCAELRDAYAQELGLLEELKERIRAYEADRRHELKAEYDARLAQLTAEEAKLVEREAKDLERAMETLQARHIHDALRRASLRSASIPLVGWRLKSRLMMQGVWAAADLNTAKIRSLAALEEDKLLALVTWRVECERSARRSAPQRLPSGVEGEIARKQYRRRERIAGLRQAAEAQWSRDDADLTADCIEKRDALECDEVETQRTFEADMQSLQDELEDLRATVPALESQLRMLFEELYPYRHIRFRRYLELILGGV